MKTRGRGEGIERADRMEIWGLTGIFLRREMLMIGWDKTNEKIVTLLCSRKMKLDHWVLRRPVLFVLAGRRSDPKGHHQQREQHNQGVSQQMRKLTNCFMLTIGTATRTQSRLLAVKTVLEPSHLLVYMRLHLTL